MNVSLRGICFCSAAVEFLYSQHKSYVVFKYFHFFLFFIFLLVLIYYSLWTYMNECIKVEAHEESRLTIAAMEFDLFIFTRREGRKARCPCSGGLWLLLTCYVRPARSNRKSPPRNRSKSISPADAPIQE